MQKLNEHQSWFKEAHFGMFIHWGLYSIPAGRWENKKIPGLGEWIIATANIPLDEYKNLANQFNPTRFNAEEWVAIAKQAGMKYIVITTKHCEGFSMFKSETDAFNVFDATPFRRDVVAELSQACKKENIRFGVYYSHYFDYSHPGGAKGVFDPKNFAEYLKVKVKPQLKELLTNYGPIGLIWFDTPQNVTKEQSQDLYNYVKSLQSDCLINERLGNGICDYRGMGDNQSGAFEEDVAWETPATMNDTWGYKKDDNNWKSNEDLLHLLIDCTSRGGNYLLNVGPTSEGIIPPESIERLKWIGDWVSKNKNAIYGTKKTPFSPDMKWVRSTTKDNHLFLFPLSTKNPFHLFGLKNSVISAKILGYPEYRMKWSQEKTLFDGTTILKFDSSMLADIPFLVIDIEFEGVLQVNKYAFQETDGSIALPAIRAELHKSIDSALIVSKDGLVRNWRSMEDYMLWIFTVYDPGLYKVQVVIGSCDIFEARDTTPPMPEVGYTLRIEAINQTIENTFTVDERLNTSRSMHYPEFAKLMGQLKIEKAGTYSLELKLFGGIIKSKYGITLSRIELIPV